MRCSSCGKDKAELHIKNSELIAGMKLQMCQTCIDMKLEPRHIVIIASRSFGSNNEKVRDFIVKKRYLGEPITGLELIV